MTRRPDTFKQTDQAIERKPLADGAGHTFLAATGALSSEARL